MHNPNSSRCSEMGSGGVSRPPGFHSGIFPSRGRREMDPPRPAANYYLRFPRVFASPAQFYAIFNCSSAPSRDVGMISKLIFDYDGYADSKAEDRTKENHDRLLIFASLLQYQTYQRSHKPGRIVPTIIESEAGPCSKLNIQKLYSTSTDSSDPKIHEATYIS